MRNRAFLALGLSYLVLAVLLAWILVTNLHDRIELVKEKLFADVLLIAQREENIVTRADSLLNGLLNRPEFRSGAPLSVCQKMASARVHSEPIFDQSVLLDPQANFRCTSLPKILWRIQPVFVKGVVRRFHAASLISGVLVSRSGLSQTGPAGCQFRVLPDQRSGFCARASA